MSKQHPAVIKGRKLRAKNIKAFDKREAGFTIWPTGEEWVIIFGAALVLIALLSFSLAALSGGIQ